MEKPGSAATSLRCLPETGRDLGAGVVKEETRVVLQGWDGSSQDGRDHRLEGMRSPWRSGPEGVDAGNQQMARWHEAPKTQRAVEAKCRAVGSSVVFEENGCEKFC